MAWRGDPTALTPTVVVADCCAASISLWVAAGTLRQAGVGAAVAAHAHCQWGSKNRGNVLRFAANLLFGLKQL